MENNVYELVKQFKKKYGMTIAWRIKKHSKVIEKHLNPDEKVLYAFCAQKNDHFYDITTSCVVALTNRRLLIGQKRVVYGYFLTSITPDMFNDLEVRKNLIWGNIIVDTIKECAVFSNIAPSALDEIETAITTYMMEEKKKYQNFNK